MCSNVRSKCLKNETLKQHFNVEKEREKDMDHFEQQHF